MHTRRRIWIARHCNHQSTCYSSLFANRQSLRFQCLNGQGRRAGIEHRAVEVRRQKFWRFEEHLPMVSKSNRVFVPAYDPAQHISISSKFHEAHHLTMAAFSSSLKWASGSRGSGSGDGTFSWRPTTSFSSSPFPKALGRLFEAILYKMKLLCVLCLIE